MNLKKKISLPLIPALGVIIILVFLIVSAFVFQKNLISPEVKASPGSTCTVNDAVNITGNLSVGGNLNVGWEIKSNSITIPATGAGSLDVLCSTGNKVLGGSCAWPTIYKLLEASVSKPRSDGDGWTCGGTNESSVAQTLTAYAICARVGP